MSIDPGVTVNDDGTLNVAGSEFTTAETEYDLAFPLLPLEDDPEPAVDNDDLVDDLDDFASDEVDDEVDLDDEDQIAEGDDFAMDWEEGSFYLDSNGEPLRVSSDDAVAEWAMKALNTPKGVYAIYSENYGSDLHLVLGQSLNEAVLHAEIYRAVSDCLVQHPRIDDVEILDLTPGGDGILYLMLALMLENGDEPLLLEVTA